MTLRLLRVGLVAACALTLTSVPAVAQSILDIRKGDIVVDPDGSAVGSVQSTDGEVAVVWTGSMKVTLGLGSFKSTPRGLEIGMTREQLEAAAAKVQSRGDDKIRSLLAPGTQVRGSDHQVLAVVDVVEGAQVTLAAGSVKVRFPVSAFSEGREGPQIAMTKAQFEAAIKPLPAKPQSKDANAPEADGDKS